MKHLLIFLSFTLFLLGSNPFNITIHKKESNIVNIEMERKRANSKIFYTTYQSALKGDIDAQFKIAMMYGTGTNIKKNEKEAFRWLHKSAFNGHLQAKYLMGLSFKQGTGVKIQKELARYWFKKALKAGHPKALYQLAELEREIDFDEF